MEYVPQEVLFSEEDLALRVQELGNQISQDYYGQEIVVICVLKGAFLFCSDLIKKINLPTQVDFISLSSYGDGVESSGVVKMNMDISVDINQKHVLVVEDIIDTGLTINYLQKMLREKGAKSVKIASLLFKPSKLKHPVDIDYLGFEIEDKFVIGYGLDYAGRYRELPYVGVLNANN